VPTFAAYIGQETIIKILLEVDVGVIDNATGVFIKEVEVVAVLVPNVALTD
jgi:hypothetical protein